MEIRPGNQELQTPGQVPLLRRYSYTLTLRKEGFEPQTAAIQNRSHGIWRNPVWIHPVGWIAGLIVDLTTGAAYDLEPADISVTLVPAEPPPEVELVPPSS